VRRRRAGSRRASTFAEAAPWCDAAARFTEVVDADPDDTVARRFLYCATTGA